MPRFTPKHLQPYEHPQHYFGPRWDNWYPVAGRSRDSGLVESSNWSAILNRLGFDGEAPPASCGTTPDHDLAGAFPGLDATPKRIPRRYIARDSHWAVGWVETIYIHRSDSEGLRIADECRKSIDDYPILDESAFSELENEEAATLWRDCYDERERFEMIRNDEPKCVPYGYPNLFRAIRAACRDADWHAAANMLACPAETVGVTW